VERKEWILRQRSFIRELRNQDLGQAATALNKYFHDTLPEGFPDDMFRRTDTSLTTATSTTSNMHEQEHRRLVKSKRADTYGPQNPVPSDTRPSTEARKTAPAAPMSRDSERLEEEEEEEDSSRPSARRSKTTPVTTVQEHHEGRREKLARWFRGSGEVV